MEEFNHFGQIADTLEPVLSKAVRKTAFDIQKSAAANAPVDTGFLKNSIYTVTSTSSNYGRGVQKAGELKANKKGVITAKRRASHAKRVARQKAQEALLNPEVPAPDNTMTAYISVGAEYGIYPEFGTVHQAAQPYFYPAVDAGRATLDSVVEAIADQLGSTMLASVEVTEE